MKKSMIIAVCLLTSLIIKAQFTVIAVSPTLVCPGDTIAIQFLYKGQPGSSQFCIGSPNNPSQAHSVQNASFYSLPKQFNGTDTVYTIRIRTNIYLLAGNALVSNDWINGVQITLYTPVGIQEINPNEIKPVYYNMQGHAIEPRSNEVMIEYRGNIRRKVLMQ